MDKPQLWILVGGNGAGKSTFYKTRLQPLGLPFINADLIARELFPVASETHSYEAAQVARQMVNAQLAAGNSFCFETVFSHPSKIDLLGKAKALGYEIIMVVLYLGLQNLNVARVSQRVIEGGHSVPVAKIKSRIPRTFENIKIAAPLCDGIYLIDNSSAENPFQVIAQRHNEQEILIEPLPQWARLIL